VRAGLAIVEAAPKLHTAAGAPLHVRVGSRRGSSSSAICWVLERRRSVRSSAIRPISPPAPNCRRRPIDLPLMLYDVAGFFREGNRRRLCGLPGGAEGIQTVMHCVRKPQMVAPGE
jgi:hypothetical protein